LDRFIGSRRKKKLAEARARFDADFGAWRQTATLTEAESRVATELHAKVLAQRREQYVASVAEWESRKLAHEENERLLMICADDMRPKNQTSLFSIVNGFYANLSIRTAFPASSILI
jgi:hypothetical protein